MDTAYVIDFDHSLSCAKLESLAPGQTTSVMLRPELRSAEQRIVGSARRSDKGDDVFIVATVEGRDDSHKWSWSLLCDRLSAQRR